MRKCRSLLAFLLSLSMIFGMFAAIPSASAVISDDDVILDLDFSDYTGGAIQDKKSGKTLMESGLEAVSGRDGKQAAKFTGTADNYIRWNSDVLDPFAQAENGITISMWVNFSTLDDWTQYFAYIKDKDDNEANGFLMQLGGSVDVSRMNVIYKGSQRATGSGIKAVKDEWTLITFSQDADKTMKAYINGELVSTATADETLYAISQKSDVVAEYNIGGPVSSARNMWSGDKKLNGLMESFTMYNRALTALEVARLYNPAAGVDDAAIENVASKIEALQPVAATSAYLEAYRAAKAAYEALTTAEKEDTRLSGAVEALNAAFSSYCALYSEENGGKLASFTFEGEDDTAKLTELGSRVTLSNDEPSTITLNAEGKNGTTAADFSGVSMHKGLSWDASSFNPFAQTGDNASVSMWVKFHAETGSISGNTTIFNALSNGHQGDSGYFIVKYVDNAMWIRTSPAVDGGPNDEIGIRSSAYTPQKDEWLLVTYVQEGTSGKLYLNDELVGTGTVHTLAAIFGAYGGTYALGCQLRGYWGDPSLNGAVDDVTIYNRALSALEVARLYDPNSGVDDTAIENVASMVKALQPAAATSEYLASCRAAKAAYEALTSAEKDDARLAGAAEAIDAAFAAYSALYTEANGGKLASFTFEGEDDTAKLTELGDRVTMSNDEPSTITLNAEGKNGNTAADFSGVSMHKGLRWNVSDFNPFAQTGDNASISMWVKFHAETGSIAGNTTIFNALSSGHTGESGYFIIKYVDKRVWVCTSTAVDKDGKGEVSMKSEEYVPEKDEWLLITYVQEGAIGKLYLNGELAVSGTMCPMNTVFGQYGGIYALGCQLRDWWGDPSLNGTVDDFTIYNRALSVVEIAEMAGNTSIDEAAVNAVKEKIDAIGEVELSIYSLAKIREAETAYKALTDLEKAYVDNYSVLEAAFDSYYTLAEAANNGRLLYFDFEDGTAIDVEGRVSAKVSGLTEVEGREPGTKAFQFGTEKGRNNDMYIQWSAADYDPFARTEKSGTSISAWVQLRETNDWATLFSYGKSDSFFIAVPQSASWHDNAFRAAAKNNGSDESDVVGKKIVTDENIGQWVLLTITQDADRNTSLYLGTELLGTAQLDYSLYTLSSGHTADSMFYNIGYVPFFGDDNFQGAMDDFAIYNHALTAEEIGTLMYGAADYTAVDAALEKAAALKEDDYTAASWAKLQTAVEAVVRGLAGNEQATIDGFAAAIEAAISALTPKSVEMELTIGTGMVTEAAAEGKYDITWNARILLGGELSVDDINAAGVQFKNYGVYYGTSADVLNDYKNATADEIRQVVFAKGEDVDVYTAYGFRLRNVLENRVRAAMFYVEYELNGQSYILLSTVDEVVAVIKA